MNKRLYRKLAFQNIKKNRKIYVPYILASIFVIMMFYNISAITTAPLVLNSYGSRDLIVMLRYGIIIVGIFSIFLIIYVNNFLSKKRFKEFGLYNILGLDKKHISVVVFYETLIVAFISLFCGISIGILFSKLTELLLSNILQIDPQSGFHICNNAIITTIMLFSVSYLITFLSSIRKVHQSNPIELLRSNNQGEVEPKVKKLKLILGVLSLSIGYIMAITISDPTIAFLLFFVAVLFVIVGTYLLFEAGSIYLLKLLKKNKKFYYHKNNFTTISGMIFRMKQNAAGLASICILSTCMLLAFSTTIALYLGIQSGIDESYPYDVDITDYETDMDDDFNAIMEDILVDNEIAVTDYANYNYCQVYADKQDNSFAQRFETASEIPYLIRTYSVEIYNKMMGTNYVLGEEEILVYSSNDPLEEVIIEDSKYNVVESIGKPFDYDKLRFGNNNGSYIFVVSDDSVMENICTSLLGAESNNIDHRIFYNTDATSSQLDKIISDTYERSIDGAYFRLKEDGLSASYAIFGGVFFIGIFTGVLFLMATVLIIYYKQIQEGYDDAQRFIIMQKVGMSKTEVKKTINKQVIMVFFLPIVVAITHIIFSYKMLYLILTMMNVAGDDLLLMCILISVLIFIVVYSIVYYITSRIYYDIVSFK